MPNDQNSSSGRRQHYHRGRRGGDRRGTERRTPPAAPEQAHRDSVDVEQIMRDIRTRISSRHGIDLTPQQIQELAARRLDAILEPRHVKPALLEQMRRAAGERIDVPAPAAAVVAPFDESQLYASHRGFVQSLRRLLNPILKLFINPAPIVLALNAQAAHSSAAAARESELYTQQAEWNALHYEIVQRLVTELARTTLEAQSLTLRMEALDAKLDFNERRVRAMELAAHHTKPVQRPPEAPSADATPAVQNANGPAAAEAGSDGARRRRRRRRGRRSGPGGQEGMAASPSASPGADPELDTETDDDEIEGALPSPDVAAETTGEGSAALEPAHHFSLLQPDERYPSQETVPTTPAANARPDDSTTSPGTATDVASGHGADDGDGSDTPER